MSNQISDEAELLESVKTIGLDRVHVPCGPGTRDEIQRRLRYRCLCILVSVIRISPESGGGQWLQFVKMLESSKHGTCLAIQTANLHGEVVSRQQSPSAVTPVSGLILLCMPPRVAHGNLRSYGGARADTLVAAGGQMTSVSLRGVLISVFRLIITQ